ncbi:MAG: hypothetical protein IJZ46_02990 [Bacilli bacterium]|nr:hypothetical protein [Bacilli bacterium]
MKKRMLFVIATIAAFALFVPSVMAAEHKVGTASDLKTKVGTAAAKDTITLTDDITMTEALVIDKELTLDLNGKTLTFDANGSFSKHNEIALRVEGGNLTITGTGTIIEAEPWYAPIVIKGSATAVANYSTVTVGENVTLKGYYGVLVREGTAANDYKSYGVVVNLDGKIETLPEVGSTDVYGGGIYVNGLIQPLSSEYDAEGNLLATAKEKYPVINMSDTAVIESDGVGVYSAGYSTWNIDGATINGVGSGIGAKAGEFNITDATITATGEYAEGVKNNNGISATGAAIQIESNSGYAGLVTLNITGGTFTSENGNALYEYNVDEGENTETAVADVKIAGGEFTSAEGKDVLSLSEEFEEDHGTTEFIEGGVYVSGEEEALVGTVNGGYVAPEEAIVLTMYGATDGKVDEKDKEELVLTKGSYLNKEDFEKLLKEGLKEENKYLYDATYADKDLKTKFDFTKTLDVNTVMYVNVTTNPETGDINLAVLIGTILIGVAGIALVLRKRFAKSN